MTAPEVKPLICNITITEMGDGSYYYSVECNLVRSGGCLSRMNSESAIGAVLDAAQFVMERARQNAHEEATR